MEGLRGDKNDGYEKLKEKKSDRICDSDCDRSSDGSRYGADVFIKNSGV